MLAGVYAPGSGGSRRGGPETSVEDAFGGQAVATHADGPLAVACGPTEGRRVLRRDGVVCLLDGSVYNAKALARELDLSRNEGPEAVLDAAYARWGPRMLERLRGDYALLVWDTKRQRGFLAQDHLGHNAIFTYRTEGRLYFASEVTTLLRLLPRRPGPDSVAVVHWLMLSVPPDGRTMYEGIERLGAGHLLELMEGTATRRSYWWPRYEPPLRLSQAELGEKMQITVQHAVESRLDPSDRVAILQSGGLDSSLVAGAARRAADDGGFSLRAYSAVLPDRPDLDESAAIDELTTALGLPSVRVRPGGAGGLAHGLEYLRDWQLPSAGVAYMLEYPLLRCAAEAGATVVLDGQGGDELFSVASYLLADRVRHGRLASSVQLLRRMAVYEGGPTSWRDIRVLWRIYGFQGALPYRVHNAIRRLNGPAPQAPPWLTENSARLYFDTADPWSWKRARGAPRWWAQVVNRYIEWPEGGAANDFLRHKQAQVNLPCRSPLRDVDVFELALRLPPELGFERTLGRPFQREAMRGLVPDAVRLSPYKSNYGAFFHDAYTGPDLPALRRLLTRADAEIHSYVKPAPIRRLVEDPPNVGQPGWRTWVATTWYLATAEMWLRYQSDPSLPERMLADGEVSRPGYELLSLPG